MTEIYTDLMKGFLEIARNKGDKEAESQIMEIYNNRKKSELKESKIKESKEKDIKVDFDIPVSEKGRIKANDAKKLLKHLAQNKLLKVGRTYFVKDTSGNDTCWYLDKSEFDGYNFSCEVTDGEDAEGNYIDRDYYNCLYFCKCNGKLTDFEWEAYRVN